MRNLIRDDFRHGVGCGSLRQSDYDRNYGGDKFRIPHLIGFRADVRRGPAWAYLNEADSNYKTYVTVMAAYFGKMEFGATVVMIGAGIAAVELAKCLLR